MMQGITTREKNLTGPGAGVQKRGDGLGIGPVGSGGPIMQGAYDRLSNDLTRPASAPVAQDPITTALNSVQAGDPNALNNLKLKLIEMKQRGVPGNSQLDPSMAGKIYDLLAPMMQTGSQRR